MDLKGFSGYVTVKKLKESSYNNIPDEQGVYVIIYDKDSPIEFLEENVGGHFKDRNPTVQISMLKANWVNNEKVIYIGQAGGNGSSATLRKRLRQYMKFGSGKPIGHWGGRYIWQLKDSDNLIVAWKPTEEDPYVVESEMINEFRKIHGTRPFANLTK
jgi:hypothetical protein